MKLKYLAHSSFLITSGSGVRIVTDPYSISADFRHKPVNEPADIVTVSHQHGDHNAVSTVQGNPDVIDKDSPLKASLHIMMNQKGSSGARISCFVFQSTGLIYVIWVTSAMCLIVCKSKNWVMWMCCSFL